MVLHNSIHCSPFPDVTKSWLLHSCYPYLIFFQWISTYSLIAWFLSLSFFLLYRIGYHPWVIFQFQPYCGMLPVVHFSLFNIPFVWLTISRVVTLLARWQAFRLVPDFRHCGSKTPLYISPGEHVQNFLSLCLGMELLDHRIWGSEILGANAKMFSK